MILHGVSILGSREGISGYRGEGGLDKMFFIFVKFHVKKLDKTLKICELLKHILRGMSR